MIPLGYPGNANRNSQFFPQRIIADHPPTAKIRVLLNFSFIPIFIPDSNLETEKFVIV
ncbi:hypothetical protein HMPREF0868_0073 [Mageeibacillus indolicus UPII9-5]|uniref:Uncharacterized protein n=2 Tax=Mageeibacillus indolicus TaxID=884684 RepID=D3QZS0_MAGIU|nr:hypothetical protein HMPREF0868_0073 [Mageeibacillus indolicus UPII9-5]